LRVAPRGYPIRDETLEVDMRAHTAMIAPALLAQQGDRIRIDLDLTSLVGYALIGLVVGLLARLVVPGRTHIGLLATILIGVVGAVVGGWLAGELFEETEGVDWIASVLVAAALVLLLQAAGSRRRPTWGRRF
jgi:uncharacterized membrane protein YeaQ/YmgE (transglycosylase-associated protein family)